MKIWVAVALLAGLVIAGFAAAGFVVLCGIYLITQAGGGSPPTAPSVEVGMPIDEEEKPRPRVKEVNPDTPLRRANTNAVLAKWQKRVTVKASSEADKNGTAKAIDGDRRTAWVSAGDVSRPDRTTEWIEVRFPEPVSVNRVTIVPSFTNITYAVTEAKIDLTDSEGKSLFSTVVTNGNAAIPGNLDTPAGFEFHEVRTIRITALSSAKKLSPVAIAEVLVE